MSDGKSLEHVGVVPGEVLLSTAKDLAGGRPRPVACRLPVRSRDRSRNGRRILPDRMEEMSGGDHPTPLVVPYSTQTSSALIVPTGPL